MSPVLSWNPRRASLLQLSSRGYIKEITWEFVFTLSQDRENWSEIFSKNECLLKVSACFSCSVSWLRPDDFHFYRRMHRAGMCGSVTVSGISTCQSSSHSSHRYLSGEWIEVLPLDEVRRHCVWTLWAVFDRRLIESISWPAVFLFPPLKPEKWPQGVSIWKV